MKMHLGARAAVAAVLFGTLAFICLTGPAAAQSQVTAGLPAEASTVALTPKAAAAPSVASEAGETGERDTTTPGAMSEREKRERLARALMLFAAPGGRPFPQLSR